MGRFEIPSEAANYFFLDVQQIQEIKLYKKEALRQLPRNRGKMIQLTCTDGSAVSRQILQRHAYRRMN